MSIKQLRKELLNQIDRLALAQTSEGIEQESTRACAVATVSRELIKTFDLELKAIHIINDADASTAVKAAKDFLDSSTM